MLATLVLLFLSGPAAADDAVPPADGEAVEAADSPAEVPAPPPTREDAPESARWDLSHIFATPEDFDAALAKVELEIDALADCEGQLSRSAGGLLDCSERMTAVTQQMRRLGTYANGHANVDVGNAEFQARRGEANALWGRFAEVLAYSEPEIVAMGSKKLERFLRAEPALAPYAYRLRNIQRDAAHTGTTEEQSLLAATQGLQQAPATTYRTLSTVEMPWRTVTLSDGREVVVDLTGYVRHRAVANRDDRQAVFDAFYGALAELEGTYGALMSGHVQGHWFVARTKNYPDSLSAALAGDHIPSDVYRAMVEGVNGALPTLHRYLKLRSRILGIDDLGYQDLYVPIVDTHGSYSLQESKRLTLESAAPLGETYVAVLREGLDARWMDVYPSANKRGGAYMDSSAWDVHPYLLLNHTDDYGSVSTMAHEWGHAVHSVLARRAQPYQLSDYATFNAEIASQVAEVLLVSYMLDNAESDDERLLYLGAALEEMRTSLFRQTMFAEFELALHTKVEAGEALTGKGISEVYLDLVRRYCGHDSGVTVVDEAYAVEWAAVRHFFYYDFYVWQYATSLAASSLLAQRIVDGEPGAVEAYLGLLEAGGSDDPTILLEAAGVDMASTEPYAAAARRMDAIMDDIETILDTRDSQ